MQLQEKEKQFLSLFRYTFGLESFSVFCIAVSGGPDSMFLLFLLDTYRQEYGITIRLCVLHYDHNMRPESAEEQKALVLFCGSRGIECVSASYLGSDFTESTLREERYAFFNSVLHGFSGFGEKGDEGACLFLGHHLDDRLETSLLHLQRGCHLAGMINMTGEKKKHWRPTFPTSSGPDCFHFYRPLLKYTKKEIYEACLLYNIDFVEDVSNQDTLVSQRNAIRKRLSTVCTKSHYLSYTKLIHFLEDILVSKKIKDIDILPLLSPRDEVTEYYAIGPISDYFQLRQLFDFCGIYKNIHKDMLNEFLMFFSLSQGWKHLRGWSFFRSHGQTYAVKSTVKFTSTGLPLSLQSVDILKYKMASELGSDFFFRLSKTGDVYKSKSLSKFYISEKIPVFFRSHLLVSCSSSVDGKIFAMTRRRYLKTLGRL